MDQLSKQLTDGIAQVQGLARLNAQARDTTGRHGSDICIAIRLRVDQTEVPILGSAWRFHVPGSRQ